MTMTNDPVALDAWYVVGVSADLARGGARVTRLLGQDIALARDPAGVASAHVAGGPRDGAACILKERYGYLWTSLGTPARPIFDIAEADEPDRRLITCGCVEVGASGLRLVENFLDMAHFPFVHTNVLGAVDHPEVEQYQAEIRADVDEVWATNCRFWQPLAALTSTSGQMSQYVYRVATPFNTVLYKTCPADPARFDAIALFIQPVESDVSIAYPLMVLIDNVNSDEDIIAFQQNIFLQDRMILENQRPRRLPLDARAEMPTRADLSSVAFRRWLKAKGLRYGVHEYAGV